jgi:hypothetical protein
MRQFALFLTLLLSFTFSHAQDYYIPDNHFDPDYQELIEYMNRRSASRLTEGVEYIPVQVHNVVSLAGHGMDFGDFNESMLALNAYFEPINLQFYLCSEIDVISVDSLYQLDSQEESNTLTDHNFQRIE